MSDPVMRGVELPDSELLKKFDVPAPRYTSYPTADRFNDGFTAKDYEAELAGRKDAKKPAGLSGALVRIAVSFPGKGRAKPAPRSR